MDIITALIIMANTERSTAGLVRVQQNAALTRLASVRAEQVCDKVLAGLPVTKEVMHAGMEAAFDKDGQFGGYEGENLAFNLTGAEAMHQAWMQSPTHKANIMHEYYRYTGIAKSSRCNVYASLFSSSYTPRVIQKAKRPSVSRR